MNEIDAACDDVTLAGPAIFQRFWQTGRLSRSDLRSLSAQKWKRLTLEPHQSLDAGDGLYLLYRGRAIRSLTEEGEDDSVSIAILVPGDICDYAFLTGFDTRTELTATSKCGFLYLEMAEVVLLVEQHPAILGAILALLSCDQACTEELLYSIANRSALGRMAHLLCELEMRLRKLGLSKDGMFHVGLTQAEIGKHLGLSAVHVNRTMQTLRRDGLIRSSGPDIALLDQARLANIGGFKGDYLQGGGRLAEQLVHA